MGFEIHQTRFSAFQRFSQAWERDVSRMSKLRRAGFINTLLFAMLSTPVLENLYALHRQASPGRTAAQGSSRGGRLRPPDNVTCPRNNLTSFTGRVTSYLRGNTQTVIRMRTDEETNEKFIIRHAPKDNPSRWYMLNAEPFQQGDWMLIESSKNRVRPRTRATAWVCDDGTNPIIDWKPAGKN